MVKANTKNDMEIETQLYAMIKTMKNNKVTKQFVDITFCVSPNGRVNPNRGWGGQERFSYSVNRNGTTKQLISDLNDKLKVKHLRTKSLITYIIRQGNFPA